MAGGWATALRQYLLPLGLGIPHRGGLCRVRSRLRIRPCADPSRRQCLAADEDRLAAAEARRYRSRARSGSRAAARSGSRSQSPSSSRTASPSTRKRGRSSAACGSSPSSTIAETSCTCAWAWMKPPITPNGPSSSPSRSSIPGMIVWYGRRPGSTAPADREARAAVLEDDAGSRGDDPRAEPLEEALDERDGHPLAVDRAEVDGPAGRLGHRRLGHAGASRYSGRRSAR